MTDMAYIISRTLERKIAIAENNDQNTLFVTLDVLKEILALLKEQEARLMTKEEIINWDGYIWKEHKDISTMNVSEIKHEIEFVPYEGQFNTKNFTWNTYCRLWRCWSNKPTDKQRKKVKWDE